MVRWLVTIPAVLDGSYGAIRVLKASYFGLTITLHSGLFRLDCADFILCYWGKFAFIYVYYHAFYCRLPSGVSSAKMRVGKNIKKIKINKKKTVPADVGTNKQLHSTILTLISSIFQMAALIWYLVSYFPMGGTGLQYMGRFGAQRVTNWVTG